MIVFEALHERWWWKLIKSGVLVPDMEVLTGRCHQKCGWMYGKYPKQAELFRLVDSEWTYPEFQSLIGNSLAESFQAKPKTQLGQMPCIQALRLVARQAEGCEGADPYGRYQIKQPAKSREIIKSSRYCTELMSGVQYPGVRCRARRREYPSLSLNSPTWVSHWSSPRRWKRSRPVCWMRERSFTCRRAQGRRDGTRSWVVQTDSETCLAPKNPKEKKVLKLVSCSGS